MFGMRQEQPNVSLCFSKMESVEGLLDNEKKDNLRRNAESPTTFLYIWFIREVFHEPDVVADGGNPIINPTRLAKQKYRLWFIYKRIWPEPWS